MDISSIAWAEEEFGHARLGHRARNSRLIKMAARAAETPAGPLTEVFDLAAERSAAYRFVEGIQGFDFEDISASSAKAAIRRCRQASFVYCPIDLSTLSIPDPHKLRELGPIDDFQHQARGLQVLNALAILPEGTPAGICGQFWWTRGEQPRQTPSRQRKFEDKESRFWPEFARQICELFAKQAPTTRLWLQLDAANDFRQMLDWAAHLPWHWATIRVCQKHRLVKPTADAPERYLRERLMAQPVATCFDVAVSKSPERQARQARLALRWTPIEFVLRERNSQKVVGTASFVAIVVQEDGTTPPGEKPLEWWLVTTYPVVDTADAVDVVFGYRQRWRVEDFHRSWKTVCQVEKTRLRTREAILRWATILAAVAMRIERLKHLSRTTPQIPADDELSAEEIEAIILLRKPKDVERHQIPSLGQAIVWLAQLGGYANNPKRSPPGTQTIARGFKKISPLVDVLKHFELTEKTDQ